MKAREMSEAAEKQNQQRLKEMQGFANAQVIQA
jgi:hypothetical protein